MKKRILKSIIFLMLLTSCSNYCTFGKTILANNTDKTVKINAEKATDLKDKEKNLKQENPIKPVSDLKGTIEKKETGKKTIIIEKSHIEEKPSLFKIWIDGDYATGDWKGLRTKLEEHGIKTEMNYTNDGLLKTHGGLDRRGKLKSASLLDMIATFDTEKMRLWKGGEFVVIGQQFHGKGLTSTTLGDLQTLSSIDNPSNFIHLGEYWYKQSLFKDKFKIKIGKYDANSDFCIVDSANDYVNSSFTLIPNVLLPTYPDQGLGSAVFIEPVSWLSLKSGLYDGSAKGGTLGFDTFLRKGSGVVSLNELSIKPSIKGYNGNYIVGFWHHTGDFEKIIPRQVDGEEITETKTNSYGIYALLEQDIFREKNTEDQGLKLIGQFGAAPSNRTEISRYYGIGLNYKGLIKGRDGDVTGIGANYAKISRDYKEIDGRRQEAIIEIFHKFQLTKWLALQPDLQVVLSPGGEHKNAFVMGIRSVINF